MNLQPPEPPEDTRTDYERGLDEGRACTKCAGVTDNSCHYLAVCGHICNKCGNIHNGRPLNQASHAGRVAELEAQIENLKQDAACWVWFADNFTNLQGNLYDCVHEGYTKSELITAMKEAMHPRQHHQE